MFETILLKKWAYSVKKYLLNEMTFSILIDINEKRSKETKQEFIKELSDMLEVDLFDI